MDKKQFIHDLQNQEFYDSYNKFIFADDSKVFNKLASKFFFLELTQKIPGEIVELGVFKGSGMAGWLKVSRSMQSTRKVIGFDFFNQEALIEKIKTTDAKTMNSLFENRYFNPSGYAATLINMLNQMNFQNFELKEGDVFETIPKYLAENPGFRVSIANFDLDTEEPTYFCLNELWPRIVKNGVLIFDEYGINEWTESNAVDRFIKEKGLDIIRSDYYAPSAYIIKK
jgi:hypothetical protein